MSNNNSIVKYKERPNSVSPVVFPPGKGMKVRKKKYPPPPPETLFHTLLKSLGVACEMSHASEI